MIQSEYIQRSKNHQLPIIKILQICLGLIIFLVILTPSVTAENPAPKVLLLYKQRDPQWRQTVALIGKFVSQAGYEWEKGDVEKILAADTAPDLSAYKGIVTCYQSTQMIGAALYPRFLIRQMQAGKKIVIIGSYGAYQGLLPKKAGGYYEWNESTIDINTFFWPFGLQFLFGWTNSSDKLKITHIDSDMVEYQIKLPRKKLTYYQYFKSVNQENKVYLEVERTDVINSKSAFVVRTPFGGMALEDYIYLWDGKKRKTTQRVNLVRFIKESLRGAPPPVPMYTIKTHKQLIEENPLPKLTVSKIKTKYRFGEVKRKILVLYKKSEAPTIADNPIFDRAGILLNYLGLFIDYVAVEDGLPSEVEMGQYRGIITWHYTPYMYRAKEYNTWMAGQIRKGIKVVFFENYGAYFDADTQLEVENVKDVFSSCGIEYSKLLSFSVQRPPRINKCDKTMMGYEYNERKNTPDYAYKYVSTREKAKIYFSLDDHLNGNIDMIFTNKHGGFAFGNSAFYFPSGDRERIALIHQALAGKIQPEIAEASTLGGWIINPYRFFTEAFDLGDFPVPDYTTISGSRLYYIHIDGDALSSISLIDRAHYAGTHILKKHFRPYSDIPFSPSVISIEIEKNGNEFYSPLLELSREIYALPNIEIATHTTAHPFNWVEGDPYIINPDTYPWKLGYKPQDYVFEIWGSKLFIDNYLAPPGKKCKIVFWSGECNPNAEALKIAQAAGIKNLNGGDPIFDSEHPSVSGLCPLTIPQGEFRQNFTSAQNDYIYTLYLTGDWGGQRKLVDHFAKTESPYRILPMNLYYHFYAGIKNVSIDACISILDYFRKGKYTGIFASEYIEIVEDFFRTRIWKKTDGYYIENDGFLNTLRFNSLVYPDINKSDGILGYLHNQGQTYIHLNGQKSYKLVLTDKKPEMPFLRRATFRTGQCIWKNKGLELAVYGFGKAYFCFAGIDPDRSYSVNLINEKNEIVAHNRTKADDSGVIEVTNSLPAPPRAYKLILTPEET